MHAAWNAIDMYIWDKWVKWVIGFKMLLAKVDDRGRVQLPSNLRHRMKLKEGDEFVAENLGEDTILLKKINLRALLEDAIEKAKSIDLDKLQREIEEESNQLARQKFKVSSTKSKKPRSLKSGAMPKRLRDFSME
jgi:AbrB family looped-hinge helix DNA binding protein